MLSLDEIEQIRNMAAKEKWGFPRIFAALKAAGVTGYQVDVATHATTFECDTGETILEQAQGHRLTVVDTFIAEQVRAAIEQHQRQATSYEQFLVDIAAAGVASYQVNMQQRTISYYAQNHLAQYVEKIP